MGMDRSGLDWTGLDGCDVFFFFLMMGFLHMVMYSVLDTPVYDDLIL